MTALEFENQFDVLYNNITSNQAPGLDSYEKSVFLTKAQNEILLSYFNPRLNKSQEGFDGGEKRQIDFSNLITTVTPSVISDEATLTNPLGKSGYFEAVLPDNILCIVNEFLKVEREGKQTILSVMPIDYKSWNRMLSKPYKRPPHTIAWRVLFQGKKVLLVAGPRDTYITQDNNKENTEENTEDKENKEPSAYIVRYVRVPHPIILTNFEDGLSIHGENKMLENVESLGANYFEIGEDGKYTLKQGTTFKQACEVDPILHEDILQRGVEMAKAAWAGGLDAQFSLGVNSETNMGVVPQAK